MNIQIISVTESIKRARQLSDLESLFQSEWQDFCFEGYSSELPSPLIAVCDDEVIGGLAYTFHPEPRGDIDVVWLNALYISSDYRGQGIASTLISESLKTITKLNQNRVYVYTNIPTLYQKLGWSFVEAETEENHHVLSILL